MLVGDIYQLEPVLREDDRQLLRPFYQSAYFFNAKVWQQMQLVSIELRKVYRQRDPYFVAMLDRIRQNQATDKDIAALNTRLTINAAATSQLSVLSSQLPNAAATSQLSVLSSLLPKG